MYRKNKFKKKNAMMNYFIKLKKKKTSFKFGILQSKSPQAE